MGNTSSSSSQKGSGTNVTTSLPSWMTPGTSQYQTANTALQTAPIGAALNGLSNGGLGSASQGAINTLQNMGGSNSWMNAAANGLQGINTGQFNQIYNEAKNPGSIDYAAQNQIAQNAQNVGQIGNNIQSQIAQSGGNVGQIGTQNYQDLYNTAGQPGAAQQYLTGTAQGDYLGGSPYLDDIIKKSNADATNAVNQMFSAAGRYGSGANQGVLANTLANNTASLLNQNYQTERQNQINAANAIQQAEQAQQAQQLGAAQGLSSAQNQNVANALAGGNLSLNAANSASNITGQNIANQMAGQNLALNAANAASNIQGQNVSNALAGQNLALNAAGQGANTQLGASQALGSLGQSAYGNQVNSQLGAANLENQGIQNQLGFISSLPTIQNNKVFDARQQAGVGNTIDQYTQTGLNNLINQFSNLDNEQWARLGSLISAATGAAGKYGTQTATSTQPPNIAGILGALLGL